MHQLPGAEAVGDYLPLRSALDEKASRATQWLVEVAKDRASELCDVGQRNREAGAALALALLDLGPHDATPEQVAAVEPQSAT